MQVNIKEFVKECGLNEPFYPGKRIVQKLAQQGEHKSHCVVYDWRNPNTLRLDVKPGLLGKDLVKRDLSKYPVSFQAATFVEIDTANDDSGDGEEEEGSGGGNGDGDKRKMKTVKALHAFSQVVEGKIPEQGAVKKIVVMGMNIAREAFAPVLQILTAQIKTLIVTPINVLAAANAIKVTVATPGGRPLSEVPSGLVANADVKYKPKDMFGVNPA